MSWPPLEYILTGVFIISFFWTYQLYHGSVDVHSLAFQALPLSLSIFLFTLVFYWRMESTLIGEASMTNHEYLQLKKKKKKRRRAPGATSVPSSKSSILDPYSPDRFTGICGFLFQESNQDLANQRPSAPDISFFRTCYSNIKSLVYRLLLILVITLLRCGDSCLNIWHCISRKTNKLNEPKVGISPKHSLVEPHEEKDQNYVEPDEEKDLNYVEPTEEKVQDTPARIESYDEVPTPGPLHLAKVSSKIAPEEVEAPRAPNDVDLIARHEPSNMFVLPAVLSISSPSSPSVEEVPAVSSPSTPRDSPLSPSLIPNLSLSPSAISIRPTLEMSLADSSQRAEKSEEYKADEESKDDNISPSSAKSSIVSHPTPNYGEKSKLSRGKPSTKKQTEPIHESIFSQRTLSNIVESERGNANRSRNRRQRRKKQTESKTSFHTPDQEKSSTPVVRQVKILKRRLHTKASPSRSPSTPPTPVYNQAEEQIFYRPPQQKEDPTTRAIHRYRNDVESDKKVEEPIPKDQSTQVKMNHSPSAAPSVGVFMQNLNSNMGVMCPVRIIDDNKPKTSSVSVYLKEDGKDQNSTRYFRFDPQARQIIPEPYRFDPQARQIVSTTTNTAMPQDLVGSRKKIKILQPRKKGRSGQNTAPNRTRNSNPPSGVYSPQGASSSPKQQHPILKSEPQKRSKYGHSEGSIREVTPPQFEPASDRQFFANMRRLDSINTAVNPLLILDE